MRLFDEFDADQDGELTVHEVCKALQSRQVEITEDQAGFFMNAGASRGMDPRARRHQFPGLVLHMAEAYVPPVAYPNQRFSPLVKLR